jgi:hypothetical protein
VLYANLLSDKKDPTNGDVTKRFLRDLESLWSEISEHLRLRGVTGLGSHKQFESKFEAIESARHGLLRDQKNRFESAKQTVNDMLSTISLPVRVAETFNPADVEGCFGRLHREASAEILKSLERELGTLRGLKRELAYASDVLRRLTSEDTSSMNGELARAEQALEQLGETITAAWVAEVRGQHEHSEVEALRVALVEGSKVSQAARTVLRESLPKQPKLSPQAKSVLSLVEEGRDLKAVILALIAQGHQSDIVLDEALAGLVELFRAGLVDITVGTPKR